MKKKIILILICIIAIAGIAAVVYFIVRDAKDKKVKYYEPEMVEPEVFNDEEESPFDIDLMIGLWQDSTVYYRYNDDFTGVTWDVADDVYEEEGVKFTWEIKGPLIIHYYKMEIGGMVPKIHTISVLDLERLFYSDEYGVEYDFVKIE